MPETQLDRIEATLSGLREDIAQLGERLARIEERNTGLSARLDSHSETLERHAARLSEMEVALALTGKDTLALKGRWAAAGAVILAALSGIWVLVIRTFSP